MILCKSMLVIFSLSLSSILSAAANLKINAKVIDAYSANASLETNLPDGVIINFNLTDGKEGLLGGWEKVLVKNGKANLLIQLGNKKRAATGQYYFEATIYEEDQIPENAKLKLVRDLYGKVFLSKTFNLKGNGRTRKDISRDLEVCLSILQEGLQKPSICNDVL